MKDRASTKIGSVTPGYKPGYKLVDMRECQTSLLNQLRRYS